MKQKSIFFLFLIVGVAAVFEACMPEEIEPLSRVPVLPAEPYDYASAPMELHGGFRPFGDSIIDNDVATLGRVLFYDSRLSLNYRVSCGSCHRQQYAFGDNRATSLGFRNDLTGRNTQQIVNAALQKGLFWDLRERILDHMVLQPIANHMEMGLSDTLEMENRIRSAAYYEPLFANAFGNPEVTTHKIGLALAQFVKSIISVSTKYDYGIKAVVDGGQPVAPHLKPFPNFTPLENIGKDAFFTTFFCSQCHGGPNFNGNSEGSTSDLIQEANVGLDEFYSDSGVEGIHSAFGQPSDGQPNNGKFKIPSLRNIAVTGPYMHDGRFETLEEVVEFYNSGIQPHPQLAEELRQSGIVGSHLGPVIPDDQEITDGRIVPIRMHMTGEEKAGIVAFLRTLTDYTMITDPKFSDPFQVAE
jgi:cytochrome c peroxidase